VTESRQPRQSREELRELLLETGLTILRENGLGTGAETLTFKRVFDRVRDDTGIRVTNASVIRRVWENQAEFQVDLLITVALGQYQGEIDRATHDAATAFATMDRSTPEARRRAMREICRVGGRLNAEALQRSRNLPSWVGVWALATSGEAVDYRRRIEEALLAGYEGFTHRIQELYQSLLGFLGFRLRENLTVRQFSIAADALAQGYGLRERIDGSIKEEIPRPSGPGGRVEEWTLFAVAFEGLINQFFEIDPDWDPGRSRS
jgi:hypothetical protein